MTTVAPSTLARVSRRELALNRSVWLATGGMFGVFACTVLIISLLDLGFVQWRLWILAGVLAVVSLSLLFSEPPPIGSAANHVVLSTIYLGVAGAMVAFLARGIRGDGRRHVHRTPHEHAPARRA